MVEPIVVPRKQQLEEEKLELEIRSLRKPVWKKREFWSVMLTAVISTASLILVIANGGFEFRSKELSYSVKT